MITAINPESIKTSSPRMSTSSTSGDFSVAMGALAPTAGEMSTVGMSQNGAVVSQAAMTGLSGAGSVASAPYYGYSASTVGISSPTFGADYATPAVGGPAPGASGAASPTAANGSPFQNPSQDFMEKDYLLKQMNDSAMNMLLLQARVQDDNRRYTLMSSIVQARHTTIREMIQHIGRI